METDRLVRKAGKTFATWRPWLSIKPSANLAGLLALPCRIAEFSCVPPHNEEEKTVNPDELSTTNTKLLNNYFWQMVIYIYICLGNCNISLTWIKAIWAWYPLLTMIPMRSQWGRYNLPRYIYILCVYIHLYIHTYIYIYVYIYIHM